MRVAGAGRRFPIPDDVQLRVDALERVRDERVAVVLEPPVLDERRQLFGKPRRVGHAAEVGLRNPRRPPLRGEHLDVGAVVDRLVRKERPLHEIDEVRADVARPSPCSLVSKNHVGRMFGAPDDDLHQVVHALHVDRRLGLGARHDLAERRAIVDQRALEHGRDLEALGHDVVGDELLRVGFGQRRLDLRQVGRFQNPRLVGQDVEAGLDRRQDAIDLHRVPAREDDDVAGTLLEHALEVVGARVHLDVPRRRALGAAVEPGDAVEVLEEIPAERRVDVHARRHAGIHLFLDERRVKMPGVEGHQAHIRPPPQRCSALNAPPTATATAATHQNGSLVFIVSHPHPDPSPEFTFAAGSF